jgi:hypothetical protein
MVGGAPGRLPGRHGPPGNGFPVEPAATIQDGTAFVIASQDSTGTPAAEPAGRAAFRAFLAGIRLSGESWTGVPTMPGRWLLPPREQAANPG